MPLDGGPERQILADVLSGRFAGFEDGIYYIGLRGPDKQYPIRFYEFSTGASRLVTQVDSLLGEGFCVSPDRKTFLYPKSATAGVDLMMTEIGAVKPASRTLAPQCGHSSSNSAGFTRSPAVSRSRAAGTA